MNIYPVSLNSYQPHFSGVRETALAVFLSLAGTGMAMPNDTFVRSETVIESSSEVNLAKGSTDFKYLKDAPSPELEIAGKKCFARIVVDLNKNLLYTYDSAGKAEKVFLVASGKASTPTKPAIKCIHRIETYPYSDAYGTQRKKNPKDYGPKLLCLYHVNVNTGKSGSVNGQYIHGNNNASSIGKYASHGCVRMDNEAVTELAAEVKEGDLVVFKRD